MTSEERELIMRFLEAAAKVQETDDWETLTTELTGETDFYPGNDPGTGFEEMLVSLSKCAAELLKRLAG